MRSAVQTFGNGAQRSIGIDPGEFYAEATSAEHDTTMPDTDLHAYESYVERQIRRAMTEGAFEDLPGAGRPLPDLDRPYDPGWWARKWAERRRRMDRAHAAVRDAQLALGEVWLLPDEASVRRRVGELNELIAEASAELDERDRPPLIDLEETVRTWRAMKAMRRRRDR